MMKRTSIVFGGKSASAVPFAGLALLTLGCILLGPSFGIVQYQPLTVETFFPDPSKLQISVAAVSVISALTYYRLARRSQSLNKLLVLAQFVLLAIAVLLTAMAVMNFASALSLRNNQSATMFIVWHRSLLGIAMTSFALGSMVSVVNLCIAATILAKEKR